jgi:hypothetical protein
LKPSFTHGCEACSFLGHFTDLPSGESWDLYYCPSQVLGGSIVARHGDSGSEYASIPLKIYFQNSKVLGHPGLEECARRVHNV